MKLPQLTLRELFLLVVIAAMGCGWWVDRNASIGEREHNLLRREQELDREHRRREEEAAKMTYLLMLIWDKYPADKADWTAELEREFPSK